MYKQRSLRVRITPQENDLIKRLAEREELNKSEYIRLSIREAAKSWGIPTLSFSKLIEFQFEEVQSNVEQT